MGFNRQTGHVPCTGTADMNFDFNGKVITIPYTDLVEQDGNGCRPLVAPKYVPARCIRRPDVCTAG